MKFRPYLLLGVLLASSFYSVTAAGQTDNDRIIQITGITVSADSLHAVPGTTVEVKNQNRGVLSSYQGVFSIVAEKGDTLRFSYLGYRTKEYVIPKDIQGEYYSMIQLMTQDTFYLPETIIHPGLSPAQFDYAMKNWVIENDKYEIARRNTDALALRVLAYTMPHDGGENQSHYQNQQATSAVYGGTNYRPSNLFSPLAWAQFIQAWKRGDFRNKNMYYTQQ